MTKILVTGAGGFIGKELCLVLAEAGDTVVPVYRDRQSGEMDENGSAQILKNVGHATDWTMELSGVDVVVHLAAIAHESYGSSSGDLAVLSDVNVAGSANLARQAFDAGVKRFVFLSSIKVNGERTGDMPFTNDQAPNPEGSYGRSKLEAEKALRRIESETGLEVVIIRPPLVYGPGVKGNLRTLTSVIKKGVPLPLGAVNNRRSLVSIYNLSDLVRICIAHPAAAGGTFLVADPESISTAELVRYIANGLGRKALLFPMPTWILEMSAGLVGKKEAVAKLTGDLEINMSMTQERLQWHPPLTVAESFEAMFAGR